MAHSEFRIERDRIVNPPPPSHTFHVPSLVDDWFKDAARQSGTPLEDYYNLGFRLAADRRLAMHIGLRAVFMGSEGNMRDLLPPEGELLWADQPHDREITCTLSPDVDRLVNWAQKEQGVPLDTLSQEGTHILGAWALRPSGYPHIVEPHTHDHTKAEPFTFKAPVSIRSLIPVPAEAYTKAI